MDKIKTGELIKTARTSKNLTQSELGDMLGVTNKAVSRWEKGESFPDVGILESLAAALDLRIQDIVVGEVRPEDGPAKETEQLLTDLIFQSNLQQRQKKKTVLGLSVWALALLFAILAAFTGLRNTSLLFETHYRIAFPVMLGLTLVLILYAWLSQCRESITTGKPEKVMCVISCVSLIWAVAFTFTVVELSSRTNSLFGMAPFKVGPLVVLHLLIILLLNVAMLICELYRWVRGVGGIHPGYAIQFSTIYLISLYGETLHRMATFNGFFRIFLSFTAVVLIEMIIALITMKIIRQQNIKTAPKN